MYNRIGYCSTFFNDSDVYFDDMTPSSSLSSTGVCLAYNGSEYAVYSQSGSSFTVNLSAASGKTLNCRFYNPRNGVFNSTFQRTGGSSAESFTKPDSSDWVLHIAELESAPGAATNPSPANSATGVGLTTDLSWTAGYGATSHNVYFGTSSPGTSRGNQTATTYDTGTMAASTTYYWRIDEVNSYGTTTGTVWSFTTGTGVSLAITNLSPANYTVQYNSLATGQLVYIDRTYTFTNVASLGGKTYIKTANADKSSTVASFMTFTINVGCTVYVAHDDVITPKPSWMSTWTDTGSKS